MPTSEAASVVALARKRHNAPPATTSISPSMTMNRPATPRDLANAPTFADWRREKRKVEALFAELKNQIGLAP